MIAISIKFLTGRYHATPWGRHVNEGAVEWPPSPWRILRAIVAAWKRTLPELSLERVEPIIRALASPPEFVLPPASTGHTRHYMPLFESWSKKRQDDRTLVFDTFVAVPRNLPVLVRWPDVTMENGQIEDLRKILENVTILGRSESWCEAELVSGDNDESVGIVCRPREEGLLQSSEIVKLLGADPETALLPPSGSTTSKKKGKSAAIYDPNWNLCMETLQLHRERWSDPPGSRWIQYARPKHCFKIEPTPRPHENGSAAMRVARYSLDSTVLPHITDALPVAEAARRKLMGIYGRLTEKNGVLGRSPIFAGKSDNGEPLEDHRHAYYLPTDEDGDGRIDHLTVYTAAGFGPNELRTLDRLDRLRTGRDSEENHPLRLLLIGLGTFEEYNPGPLHPSRVWVSATPYIATQYAKTRGSRRIDLSSPEARADFLSDDLRKQLSLTRPDLSDIINEIVIEPLWDENQAFKIADSLRPIQFKRYRRKKTDDGGRRLSGSFRLTFPRPVRGPLALGWSSHFGMGLFMPETKD